MWWMCLGSFKTILYMPAKSGINFIKIYGLERSKVKRKGHGLEISLLNECTKFNQISQFL